MSAPFTGSRSAGSARALSCRSMPPGVTVLVPQARGARATTRSWRRCPAASTSSTARCGSTMCSSRGSGCFLSTRRPRRSRAGCAGIIFTAGWRRPSSPWAWRSRLTHAMGLKEHEQTVEYLVDLVAAVQTVRSCLDRGRARPRFHPGGLLLSRPRPSRRRRHRAVQGAPAHLRDPADRARLLAGRRPVRRRSRRPRAGRRASKNLSAAAAIPRCSARHCCSSPPTMSRRRSTAANPPSSCTPAAACPIGAIGCAAASATTTSWPMRCSARSTCRCRRSTSAIPHRPDRRPPRRPAGRPSATRLIALPRRMPRRFPYPSRR